MPRCFGVRTLSACLLAASAAVLLQLAGPPTASAGKVDRMVAKINKVRAKHGVRQVRTARSLERACRQYAHRLSRTSQLVHAGRLWTRPYVRVGEILGRMPGGRPGVGAIVRAWLASPTHRPILLGHEYGHVGVGAKRRNGATVWVVRFGAR
jgi:uncharacterized protein YkwD